MTGDTLDVADLLARVPAFKGRARVVRALDGGLTNQNLLVAVDNDRYVLRLPGTETGLLEIRREAELEAASRAAALDIGPAVVDFLRPESCLITRFVEADALRPEELSQPARLADVAGMLRSFHGSGPLANYFDAFHVPLLHQAAARSLGIDPPEPQFEHARAALHSIKTVFDASPEPRVPCHNDLLNANFLADSNRAWLIDWEYAGNNDRYFDLGNLSVNNGLDDSGRVALVAAYFGSPNPRRIARLELMMIMSDFREAMWGVVQQGISTLDVDYTAYTARHFDRLLSAVHDPRFDALLTDAANGQPDLHLEWDHA